MFGVSVDSLFFFKETDFIHIFENVVGLQRLLILWFEMRFVGSRLPEKKRCTSDELTVVT